MQGAPNGVRLAQPLPWHDRGRVEAQRKSADRRGGEGNALEHADIALRGTGDLAARHIGGGDLRGAPAPPRCREQGRGGQDREGGTSSVLLGSRLEGLAGEPHAGGLRSLVPASVPMATS